MIPPWRLIPFRSDEFVGVQALAPVAPVGHGGIEERIVSLAVIVLFEVAELVDDHVVDVGDRSLDQARIEQDFPVTAATAPARLHAPDDKWRIGHAKMRHAWEAGLEALVKYATGFCPVPAFQQSPHRLRVAVTYGGEEIGAAEAERMGRAVEHLEPILRSEEHTSELQSH